MGKTYSTGFNIWAQKKRLQISIYKDLDTVMYPIQFNIQYIIAKEITSDSIERYV